MSYGVTDKEWEIFYLHTLCTLQSIYFKISQKKYFSLEISLNLIEMLFSIFIGIYGENYFEN